MSSVTSLVAGDACGSSTAPFRPGSSPLTATFRTWAFLGRQSLRDVLAAGTLRTARRDSRESGTRRRIEKLIAGAGEGLPAADRYKPSRNLAAR